MLEQLPLELQNYVEANKLSGESISSSIHICLSSLESFLFTLFQNCSFAIAAELDSCKEETSISDLDLEFHYLNAIFCCLRAWNLFPIGLRGDSIGSVYELLSLRKWLVTSEQSVEQFPLVKLVIQTQNLLLRLVYGVKSYSSVCSEILGHIFEIQNNWINSSGIPEDVLHKSDIETTTNYDTYLQRAIVVQHVFWSLQGCWDITCQRPVTDWFFEAFSIKSINIFGSCLSNINIQQTMRVLQTQALSLSKDSSKSQALLFQLSELTCLLCEKHSVKISALLL